MHLGADFDFSLSHNGYPARERCGNANFETRFPLKSRLLLRFLADGDDRFLLDAGVIFAGLRKDALVLYTPDFRIWHAVLHPDKVQRLEFKGEPLIIVESTTDGDAAKFRLLVVSGEEDAVTMRCMETELASS